MASVYEIVTERIVKALEAGVVPWRKSWKCAAGEGGPANLVSRKGYRGLNPFLLSCSGFSSPWWLTFNQAKKLGGSVRKGEKGMPVIFWRRFEDEKDENGRVPFMLRYYTVFNVEQCDGLAKHVPAPLPQDEAPQFTPIESARQIIDAMPLRPVISHGGDRAFYRPSTDSVQLPNPEAFDKPENYYSVAFHELTHSTGAAKRVGRPGIEECAAFGSPVYSREELVAEMGSAFLCASAGIVDVTLPMSAAYLDNWRRALKADVKAVVTAASAAQKAAEFILGKRAAASPEEQEQAEE